MMRPDSVAFYDGESIGDSSFSDLVDANFPYYRFRALIAIGLEASRMDFMLRTGRDPDGSELAEIWNAGMATLGYTEGNPCKATRGV